MNQHLIDLSQLGLIKVSGADAATFLQNLTTNDVARLPNNRAQYNSLCSAKGRMIASFLLLPIEDGYLLQLPVSMVESLKKRLSMYVLRSKVAISDWSENRVRIGAWGPAAVILEHFPKLPEATMELVATGGGILLRLSENRFELILEPNHPALDQIAAEPGSVWEYLEIVEGIPCIYPKTQEQFVPQMVNFEAIGGVSFNKGCYPGQEIVARTQHLGKVKRRMIRAACEYDAKPGDPIDFAGEAVGMVVRAAASPQGGCELLAVVPVENHCSELRLDSATGPMLNLLPLPYTVS